MSSLHAMNFVLKTKPTNHIFRGVVRIFQVYFPYFLFSQGKSEAITAVKLLSCFDDLVAVGTASGRVTLFQLVSQLPGRNKQVSV